MLGTIARRSKIAAARMRSYDDAGQSFQRLAHDPDANRRNPGEFKGVNDQTGRHVTDWSNRDDECRIRSIGARLCDHLWNRLLDKGRPIEAIAGPGNEVIRQLHAGLAKGCTGNDRFGIGECGSMIEMLLCERYLFWG